MKRILLALLLALAPASAWAQSARDFPTPNLGERVPLFLQGCLNASGQAVPLSASCAYQSGGSGGGTSSPVVPLGNPNVATGQASVGTTATPIVAARTGRGSVEIENTGTTPVYIGGPGVTATTGMLLPGVVGATLTIPTAAAVYGVTASGTQVVTDLETY